MSIIQNSSISSAKKYLNDISPYINKWKIAAKLNKHPNTIDSYISKINCPDEDLFWAIYHHANAQFTEFKAAINSIKEPKKVPA